MSGHFHHPPTLGMAGHLSICKTVKNIQRCFTCPKIWAGTYIKHSPSCQVNKGNNTKPPRLMQPNEVPPYHWHTVITDYATGFPKTADKHDAVAIIVNAVTKYVMCPVARKARLQIGLTCLLIMCMIALGCLCTYSLTVGHNLLAYSISPLHSAWATPGN